MDIRFLPPDLRRLDETSVELAACTFWLDERPMRGLAGLHGFGLEVVERVPMHSMGRGGDGEE